MGLARGLVRGLARGLVRGLSSSWGADLYVNSREELDALLIANGVAEADVVATWDAIWPVLIDPDTSLAYASAAAADNQIYNQGGILKADIVAAIPSSLLREDCEGGQGSWTVLGSGSVDFASTTVVLSGTKSFQVNGDANSTAALYDLGADYDSLSIYLKLQWTDTPASSSRPIVSIFDASNNIIGNVKLSNANGLGVQHGSGGSTDLSASNGTPYSVWFSWERSFSGSTGRANLYVSSNTTKGAVDKLLSNGSSTAQARKIGIYATSQGEGPVYCDDILVVSGYDQLGDNPF